jgi:hypothetical protein
MEPEMSNLLIEHALDAVGVMAIILICNLFPRLSVSVIVGVIIGALIQRFVQNQTLTDIISAIEAFVGQNAALLQLAFGGIVGAGLYLIFLLGYVKGRVATVFSLAAKN